MLEDNLGMTLREAGRYDEAEPFLRSAMETRRTVLGEEHRFFGESLNSLGTLLALRAGPGDLEEADRLLNQGLDVYLRAVGPDHPATAYMLHSLGVLEEQRGDVGAAERRYREALAIRAAAARDNPLVTETSLASDHPNRTEAEAELGLALAAAGDVPAGQARLTAGTTGLAVVIGREHPRVRALCAAGRESGLEPPPVCR